MAMDFVQVVTKLEIPRENLNGLSFVIAGLNCIALIPIFPSKRLICKSEKQKASSQSLCF